MNRDDYKALNMNPGSSRGEDYSEEYLIGELEKFYGTHQEDLLDDYMLEDIVPGICRGCGNITEEVEPEAEDNYCIYCKTNSVESVLVLLGHI